MRIVKCKVVEHLDRNRLIRYFQAGFTESEVGGECFHSEVLC